MALWTHPAGRDTSQEVDRTLLSPGTWLVWVSFQLVPLRSGVGDHKAVPPLGNLSPPQPPQAMIKFSPLALDLSASSLSYSAHHRNKYSSSGIPSPAPSVSYLGCFHPLSSPAIKTPSPTMSLFHLHSHAYLQQRSPTSIQRSLSNP